MAEQEQQQPLYFIKELLPRFDVPDDAQSQTTCMNCNKHIPIGEGHTRTYSSSKCRVFCSIDCRDNDNCVREARLFNLAVANYSGVIQMKLNAFTTFTGIDIHDFMVNDAPQNMYEFADPEYERLLNPREVKEYFIAREDLIKYLIDEAFVEVNRVKRWANKVGGRINALALDIALMQCKDLFHLDKYDSNYARSDGLSPKKEYLLSLLLFTGRYEEHYNVCCYYAQRGEQFYPPPDTLSTFDVSIGMGSDIKSVHDNGDNVVDITTSYFVEYDLHYRQFPRLSASHMFINKYTLHMNMESLRLLRYNVLDNEDCIALIGEFIGLKKDWLKYEKNWYKDQAIEVLKEFTRSEELASQFGTLHGCSDVFLSSGHYNQISRALKIGRGMISKMMKSQEKGERGYMSEHWISDFSELSAYTDRLNDEFHDNYIRHCSDQLVQKLNEIAGNDIFGANHFAQYASYASATEFFKEICEVCEKNGPNSLENLFAYLDEDEELYDLYELDEEFTGALLSCLLSERRKIQAHFYQIMHFLDVDGIHRIKTKSEHTEWDNKMLLAHEVMNSLPSELNPLLYRRPLPLPDDDPFLNYPLQDFNGKDYVRYARHIKHVGVWLADVTRVIDALFHRGLATNENLTAIFGNSSMVSYRLYELRKIKAEKSQTSITSFFSRKKARRV